MEAATANIAEMLAALDSLRAHSAESLADAVPPMTSPPRHAETAGAEAAGDDPDAVPAGMDDPDGDDDDTDDPDDAQDADDGQGSDAGERTRGRAVRSGHIVDALADLDEKRAGKDEERPLTATEAFLRSAHVDHGDPPLPQADDTDVGARYARDAMRATARARSRRDDETLEVLPDRDTEQDAGRNGSSRGDERATTEDPDHADKAGNAAGEDADASGKPLGWLFRSSS
jgi:hypothetical protein